MIPVSYVVNLLFLGLIFVMLRLCCGTMQNLNDVDNCDKTSACRTMRA